MTLDHALVSTLFALCCGIPVAAKADAISPPAEPALVERARKMLSFGTEAHYFPEIEKALEARQFAVAEKLASDAITDPASVSSPQLRAFLLSLAHLHRAEALHGLGAEDAAVNADIQTAALLGNANATSKLIVAWVESSGHRGPAVAMAPQGVAIEDVLRVGLDLDDAEALKAAAEGYGRYSDLERTAFGLRYQYLIKSSSFVDGVRQFIKMPGAQDYMRTHFLVGAEIADSVKIPGRNALATFLSESNLRNTMAYGLKLSLSAERPERDMALREYMELISWVAERSGLATAVHFTSEEPGISAPHHVLDPQRLRTAIISGDAINVRCGGIAHTSLVLRVDAARDEILLSDPFYEYWKPENNSCITHFALTHYKYGFYASVLKLSEVMNMLDSVLSYRSFSPPVFVAASVQNGRPAAGRCKNPGAAGEEILGQSRNSALKRNLFTRFNFEEIGAGNQVTHYVMRDLEFRGNVVMSLWTRKGCVVSASLFLRRLFVQERQRIFASDLMMSFLREMLGDAYLKELRTLTTQPGPKSSKVQELDQAWSGGDASASIQFVGRNARFSSVVATTGSRWLRIDAR